MLSCSVHEVVVGQLHYNIKINVLLLFTSWQLFAWSLLFGICTQRILHDMHVLPASC
jgi:hypothetical protein